MAITDLDEQLLVRAHQAGDEHAFGQIVRSQHRALYAHAFRRLGNHEAAEDAVQDTLLRAYRALPSFDGDLRLRAWLHRILTNVCHDEGNRRRRAAGLIEKLESQPEELAPDPVEEAVLHDTVRVMNEALAELPDSYREALVLRYVDGLSFKEVGEVTGISEENARARVHRGRAALHKILSRVTVMIAFLVPGLRGRAGKALDADAISSATSAEPAISLSTRLASHVGASAPALERVATEGSTLLAAKSSVVATTVAAVAAVSAPVVAYQVYDTAQAPQRPPAAVAPPTTDEPVSTTTTITTAPVIGEAEGFVDTDGDGVVNGPTTTQVDSDLPPSASAPFAPVGEVEGHVDEGEATTTTSTTAPAPATTMVEASVESDSLTVTGTRPDLDVLGAVTLQTPEREIAGELSGSLFIAEGDARDASAELRFDTSDGTTLRIRFTGAISFEAEHAGSTTFELTGAFSIPHGDQVGVAESGQAAVTFVHAGEGSSTIQLDLQGPASEA